MIESDPVEAIFRRAIACEKAGRIDEAIRHHREVLARSPAHADALHMLGRLAAKAGDARQGLDWVRKALTVAPQHAGYHNTLGKLLLADGQRDAAERAFREALRLAPELAPAHFNLGRLARAKGDADAAEGHLRRATELHPQHAPGWNTLGQVLASRGLHDEAERCFRRLLEIDPRRVEGHHNLGAVFELRGERAAAASSYRDALRLDPRFALAHRSLGKLLLAERHASEALHHLVAATRAAPKIPEVWMDLALGQHAIGAYGAATHALRRALDVDSRHVPALLALGQILHHVERRVHDAERCYRRALALDPRSARAHLGLAELRQEDEPEEALPLFEKALELDPTLSGIAFSLARLRADLCDWRQRDADLAAIPTLVEKLGRTQLGSAPLPPFHLNSFPMPPALHLRAARLTSQRLEGMLGDARAALGRPPARPRKSRLTIGYLSPDFRGHVVGRLLRDLFRHHDRNAVEVVGYSLVDARDDVRHDIERGLDRFVDLSSASPDAAARRIRADGVDVLVDLGGYSSHTRAEIVALRPAPVQVHWLGYLDTMGASFMPYLIADAVVLPADLAQHYDEAVVRLPDCFLASSPLRISEQPLTRSEVGLPDHAFVFCCFNHPVKIGPEAFGAWMRILEGVPESVLWLYDRGLRGVRENLRREAHARGIDPERLRFSGLAPEPEYLARYRLADLFLDTFHWNAGATAVGALGSGVPVITRPGETYLARMGASLCRVAGTPETVCTSDDAYVDCAVSLAREPQALAALRARLGAALGTNPLFDLRRFTAHLEEAFRRTWDQHVSGEAPHDIDVPSMS